MFSVVEGRPPSVEVLQEPPRKRKELLKPDKPVIQLWGERLFGMIVIRPSGVYYSNQTGGYACYHPMEEGVFIPLGKESVDQEKELCDYFTGAKWAGWCCEGIDEETAGFIEALMAKSHLTQSITVDRTRLQDSQEAWVYVDFSNTEAVGWRCGSVGPRGHTPMPEISRFLGASLRRPEEGADVQAGTA